MSKKLTNNVCAFFSKPANVILVVFLVVLAALTLYPLLSLIGETLIVHPMEVQIVGARKGSSTGFHGNR